MTQIIGDPKIEVKESLCGKNDENSNKCVVRFPDTLYNNLNNKIQNVNKYRKSQRDNNEKYNHCRFFPIFILMIHDKFPHIYNQ